MDPDRDLVMAWQDGDKAAGEVLFEKYFGRVYDFFAYKIDGDVADLVQRTFLVAIEKRAEFRGDAKFSTFLHAIARLELLKFFERKGKGQMHDPLTSSLIGLTPTPSSLARHKDDEALLVHALRRIPIDLQIALELHYFEGLRGPDLSLVLDIPEGTVRSRLRRAIEQLRAELTALAGRPRGDWESEHDLEAWAKSLDPYKSKER
jgi:RNA polymerase sigma factor (sigma-70 family)